MKWGVGYIMDSRPILDDLGLPKTDMHSSGKWLKASKNGIEKQRESIRIQFVGNSLFCNAKTTLPLEASRREHHMADGFLPNTGFHSFRPNIFANHDPFQSNRFEEDK